MLPARYDAPFAQAIFSDAFKIQRWKEITDAYAIEAIEDRLDSYSSDATKDDLISNLKITSAPTQQMIAEYEAETGHDVVAFLSAYCVKVGSMVAPFIHDGLTSSDLVEYGLFRMLSAHAQDQASLVRDLGNILMYRWLSVKPSIRAGRTHGQFADHTSWNHQMAVIEHTLRQIQGQLHDVAESCQVLKYAGPTGWPGAFPEVHARGRRIADRFDLEYTPATQVVPRDRLLEWGAVYLRLACALENLALQVRLAARADVAEVREGDWRVGSSAMPHKQNPIDSEKVCGLARLARGYFLTLAEGTALWEDRDLSNSAPERVAVADLAATVEHMTRVMIKVMQGLVDDREKMYSGACDPRAHTNIYQVVAQRLFDLSPIEASTLIREGIGANPDRPTWWAGNIEDILDDRGLNGEAWWDGVRKVILARHAGPPTSMNEAGGPDETRPHDGRSADASLAHPTGPSQVPGDQE